MTDHTSPTDEELKRWANLDKDATPAPWGVTISSDPELGYGAHLCAYDDHKRSSPLIVGDAPFATKQDAEIAALPRSAFADLVAEIRQLRRWKREALRISGEGTTYERRIK
jgi:hypothetical protein